MQDVYVLEAGSQQAGTLQADSFECDQLFEDGRCDK